MEDSIQLSPEQQKALRMMLSGKNVFLTGEAGTGKSTILRKFREQCTRECVFLAPTGIAAINIGGATLHSFFLLKPGLLTPDSIEEISSKSRRALIRKVKTIVIDEISMVRSDVFAAMDLRLRSLASGSSQTKPFGGKQIILVGDFFQLPPVVKTETEDTYLSRQLGGYYVFQTELWNQADFHCVFLKTIHRQQNDNLFLSILNHIRHGELDRPDLQIEGVAGSVNVVQALTELCTNQPPLEPEPIYLCTTNREAQTMNAVRKSQLSGENMIFKSVITGKFMERDYPTPAILELKLGARVMVLNNKRTPDGKFEYVNGEVGVVEKMSQDPTPTVQVLLDNGKHVSIQAAQWNNMEYELEKDRISGKEVIRQKVVGTFIQLPLKLAYAITVHKAQGLSLERVCLKLGNGCFSHGQLYTALSRCRTLRNLRMDRPLYREDVILDPVVIDFYRQLEAPEPEHQEVTLSIPKEHEAAVLALLARLQKKEAAPHPRDDDTPLFPLTMENESDEPEKITSSPDIDHLLAVYRNQTGDEQQGRKTNRENGIGFNKNDAPILSELAETFLAKGFLTRSELQTVSRKIQKYRKQWE